MTELSDHRLKEEPFFSFVGTEGVVVIFTGGNEPNVYEHLMKEHLSPAIKITRKTHPLYVEMNEKRPENDVHVESVIIPVGYTKVFRA